MTAAPPPDGRSVTTMQAHGVTSLLASWPSRAWLAGAVVLLAVVPVFGGTHLTAVIGRGLVFAILALSLDLLWGYTGQLSLGHAAWFGLGAYTAGLVLSEGGIGRSVLAIALAIAVPAAFGLVMGYLLFRGGVSGVYFAIVTLLVSLLLEQLSVTWSGFTGGISGLYGMAPIDLGFMRLDSLTSAYYAALVVLTVVFVGSVWLTRSGFGRALLAIRSNEHRASTFGFATVTIKTVVFTMACGLAGLSGLLYVPLERFVYPAQLGLIASTGVVVWVVIGGRGTLVGPVIGAVGLAYLASELTGRFQQQWTLMLGLFLVVVVMLRPGGLYGLATESWRFVSGLVGSRGRDRD